MKPENQRYRHGFKVPEDYFDGLEGRIMQQLDEQSRSLPERSGFSVPEDYFVGLEDRILDKIENKEDSKVISIRFKKEWLYSAAAILVIALLLTSNFFINPSQKELGWEDVDINTMELYIDEGYDNGIIELNASDYSGYIFTDGDLIKDNDFETVDSETALRYIDENVDDPDFIID